MARKNLTVEEWLSIDEDEKTQWIYKKFLHRQHTQDAPHERFSRSVKFLNEDDFKKIRLKWNSNSYKKRHAHKTQKSIMLSPDAVKALAALLKKSAYSSTETIMIESLILQESAQRDKTVKKLNDALKIKDEKIKKLQDALRKKYEENSTKSKYIKAKSDLKSEKDWIRALLLNTEELWVECEKLKLAQKKHAPTEQFEYTDEELAEIKKMAKNYINQLRSKNGMGYGDFFLGATK